MKFDPSGRIQDFQVFGEFGEVNPSITDSSTYTFLDAETMQARFGQEIEGCFLYSRHWSPSNRNLASALAAMEDTEDAHVTASGMGAITATLLQLCSQGDEIVASRTIYGGTWAFLRNFLPRFGVGVRFVDCADADTVRAAVTPRTRVIYCESMSNPLLSIPDIPALADIARTAGAALVVDNTFTPMILSPKRLGADVVVHSLTKFVNGMSDCVAGAVCASHEFINRLSDVNSGTIMLLGPTLDSLRAASLYKNLHTLHIRMQKHGANALFIAERLAEHGLQVRYPGLPSHPQHTRLKAMMNEGYGFGGMLALDVGDERTANRLLKRLQEEKVGLLAVSLGYFRTLFSPSGNSTSSEIPKDEQQAMGLSAGLVRFSIGLDHDIARTWARFEPCLKEVGLIR
ncbi:MAG TPA: aminotransferase class I/II-fold pyridoxal phosphate-dependent enzyme [Gammaproteobacteria bacterium]|nr:aminotransferase class I/II-fold pyridoxal phosphate-dependent enzyme [Gammaproteobacteria bacterium]